jgi:DNA polymerase-3 subunit epsilon/exodeoxyribonuclease X
MLIFLDLETTGLDKNDKICSVGLVSSDKEIKYDLVNEHKKITSKASSVHNITNEMIKDKSRFIDTQTFKFLDTHNNLDTTLVVHGAKFCLDNLLACGLRWKGGLIDTMRIVKHTIAECEFFSLQFLRYELKLYKNEKHESLAYGMNPNIVAHNALCDALIVKLLYDYLLDYTTMDKMYELSCTNVLIEKLNFGKYAGRYIEEIVMNDRKYLQWLLRNISDLDEDMRYSIEYYLEGCL